MITLSNALSIIRLPLAFLFFWQSVYIRIIAVILAMFTDSVDGYFARKYKSASKFGAFLDPAMDKFFVYFVLAILLFEKQVLFWQVFAMISRDFSLIIFAIYLSITKKWSSYEIRPARWGKVTTAMQFCVLIGITLGLVFSKYIFSLFIVLGFLAFIELIVNSFAKRSI